MRGVLHLPWAAILLAREPSSSLWHADESLSASGRLNVVDTHSSKDSLLKRLGRAIGDWGSDMSSGCVTNTKVTLTAILGIDFK